MAVFRSAFAFDDTLLDFHAPFEAGVVTTAHVTEARNFAIVEGYSIIGPLAVHMAGFSRSFTDGGSVTSTTGAAETAWGHRLTYDGAGQIKTGSVEFITVTTAGGTRFDLAGMKLDGAAYASALASADTQDDRDLFALALAGNDRIILSNQADLFHAGTGRDMVMGHEGNDTLYGDGGNDLIEGGRRHDLLYGGTGNDLLFGGYGHDTVYGGTGDDTLWGGFSGPDTLQGDGGADVFLFRPNAVTSLTTVLDFQDGVDHIALSGSTSAGQDMTFADLTLTQRAEGTLVSYTYDNGVAVRMLLSGVAAASLTADDFTDASLSPSPIGAGFAAFWHNWSYWLI